jgi:hypothetical protein
MSNADIVFDRKAPVLMQRLMQRFNLKDFQAGAIAGNGGHESAGFTILQEVHPRGGEGGYGWFQWTGPRRRAYFHWCLAQHLSPSSDEANMGYLIAELSGPYKIVVADLKQTEGLSEAVMVFEQKFEGAGVPALGPRRVWANMAMAVYRAQHEKAPG